MLIRKIHPDAVLPAYAHEDDAGFDLHVVEETTIGPDEVKILATGLCVAIPPGHELQIRLRSSAALRTPLLIPNAPATIDAGYRGQLGIIVRNVGKEPWTVRKGERLVQGIVTRVERVSFRETEELPPSERGAGGYGSSGIE